MKEEVLYDIKQRRNGKAVGPNKIHAELLKMFAEDSSVGLKEMTKVFNEIYSTGILPKDWLKSVFVTIPKKTNSTNCDDYRMISLMSHALKTFLRIIHESTESVKSALAAHNLALEAA